MDIDFLGVYFCKVGFCYVGLGGEAFYQFTYSTLSQGLGALGMEGGLGGMR